MHYCRIKERVACRQKKRDGYVLTHCVLGHMQFMCMNSLMLMVLCMGPTYSERAQLRLSQVQSLVQLHKFVSEGAGISA